MKKIAGKGPNYDILFKKMRAPRLRALPVLHADFHPDLLHSIDIKRIFFILHIGLHDLSFAIGAEKLGEDADAELLLLAAYDAGSAFPVFQFAHHPFGLPFYQSSIAGWESFIRQYSAILRYAQTPKCVRESTGAEPFCKIVRVVD
jgi:hypothetical protein